jgi:hypothetical protein
MQIAVLVPIECLGLRYDIGVDQYIHIEERNAQGSMP